MKQIFIFFVFLSLSTTIVYGAGMIPCEGSACRACDLVQMFQGILEWFIATMATLIAIMFIWGGLKMVMSAGNSGEVSKAKGIMTNSVIGFIILLAGWLIVDTALKYTVKDSVYGVWNKIECVANPAMSGTGTSGGVVATTTPAGTCSITPLTPITDPLALLMEGGQTVIWDNTAPQLKICAAKMGGTVTSAYRPPAYQTHLKEVYDKWCTQNLASNTDPACAEVKSAVSAEMSKHGLSCSYLVATNSNHSTGIAVDISGGPQVSKNCLTWFGPADKVHYTLQSGCTCN